MHCMTSRGDALHEGTLMAFHNVMVSLQVSRSPKTKFAAWSQLFHTLAELWLETLSERLQGVDLGLPGVPVENEACWPYDSRCDRLRRPTLTPANCSILSRGGLGWF